MSSAISSRSAQPMRTARSAASGISIGSLKKSWTPSPSRKPTVASKRFTRRPIAPWNSPSTRISSSGSTASTKLVQPRRSAKNIATCRRWLERIVSSPEETIGVGELRREEAPQPPQPLELVDLRLHTLLERAVELGELCRLRLDRVVVALDPEQRPHPGEQLVVVEGLRDEVVRAGLDRLRLLLADARRDHDHRQHRGVVVRAEVGADGVAVEAGHHHVEEDQVGFLGRDELERLQAVARGHDLVAARDQHRLEQADVLRYVVDDEDLGRPLSSRSQCSRTAWISSATSTGLER